MLKLVFFKLCFLTRHRFLLQCRSCVLSRIGNRSLGFTSLLLPASAIQKPGTVPFSHSLFRINKVCPNQFRTPLHRSWKSFAKPLHINNGSFIHAGAIRFVHGASCLHSFGRVFDLHALGILRFPFTNVMGAILISF